MAIVTIDDTNLSNIAKAIRSKNGSTNTYKPSEMANAISNIESGGSQPEYTRVGYIQFTGEQTIDTGIICNLNTKIKIVYTRESSSAQYMYGVASSGNTATVTAYLSSGGAWRFGNKSASSTITVNENLVNCAIVDKTGIIRAGAAQSFSGTSNFETVGSLTIGSCRNSSGTLGTPQFVGKIYSFEMWNGEEKMLDLVPMVNKEGVYGFWDDVSKTFLTSITDTQLQGE